LGIAVGTRGCSITLDGDGEVVEVHSYCFC